MPKSIFVFDSGVGGLTVLHHAMKKLPYEHFTYFADVKNAPYGHQSSDDLRKVILDLFGAIDPGNIKACVIACHTVTSLVIDELSALCQFPVIGMELALKPAQVMAQGKKIILLATEVTLKERQLNMIVDEFQLTGQLIPISVPELVQAAEHYTFDTEELMELLLQKFDKINLEDVGAIVLGCTHCVYFKPLIDRMIPKSIELVDGNLETISRLESIIEPAKLSHRSNLSCILSGSIVNNEFLLPYLSYCDKHQINSYERT